MRHTEEARLTVEKRQMIARLREGRTTNGEGLFRQRLKQKKTLLQFQLGDGIRFRLNVERAAVVKLFSSDIPFTAKSQNRPEGLVKKTVRMRENSFCKKVRQI